MVSETTEETVCELQPRRATEGDNAGEIAEGEFTAYFMPDLDLTTADGLVLTDTGEAFEFVGKPPTWRYPSTGANGYTAAYVKRTAGSEDAS